MIADYKNLGTTSFLEVNLYPRTGMVPSTCSLFTLLVMEMVRGIIDCFYTGQSPDAQSPNTKKVKWAWLGVLFTNKT